MVDLKVEIKNYQVIKNAELNFVPGINAIVGATNNGKSSIIRAIRGAINNQGGSSFINYDANEASVSITFNDHEIIWTKSKKQGKSAYIIDGKKLTKIGQTQLPEVAEIMNMPEVEVNNDRHQINFWRQMDRPFLIDKTPYQLFDFISKSKEQELITGLKDITEGQLKTTNKSLDANFVAINSTTNEIIKLKSEVEELEKFNNFNLAKLEKLLEFDDKIDKALSLINNPAIETYKKQAANLAYKVDSLKESVSSINDSLIILKQLDDKVKVITDADKTISSINIDKLKTNSEKAENLLVSFDALNKEYQKIVTLINETNATTVKCTELELNISTCKHAISQITEELNLFEVCPLCGNHLKQEEHI